MLLKFNFKKIKNSEIYKITSRQKLERALTIY